MRWTSDRIRSARERLGLSQGEAAERLGVSTTSVSSWERGIAVPRNLAALDDLFGEADDSVTLKRATKKQLIFELLEREIEEEAAEQELRKLEIEEKDPFVHQVRSNGTGVRGRRGRA